MSVYKSQRGESKVEFLNKALQLREMVIKLVRKLPKSYRYLLTNGMLEEATAIHHNAAKANAVFMCKTMNEHDYELRHRYLQNALSSLNALSLDITLCFNMLDKDKNGTTFKTIKQRDDAFQQLAEMKNKTHKLIKGVLDSDKRKWKAWHLENSENAETDEDTAGSAETTEIDENNTSSSENSSDNSNNNGIENSKNIDENNEIQI